ncbi:MAG: methyltransferase [Clostridia bacterium]|nr:methyltransferase [Clostridia bacterium]
MLKDGEVTEEFFGDKKIIQNINLYRFTSDSILLSRFARAKVNDIVADFCSGSGVVGFHFLCLKPQIKSLTLFEMQPSLADMSRRTAEMNGFNCEVVNCKLQDISREYDDKFSLILCNPPYEKSGFDNEVYEKAICRKEITITLKEIADAAFKKLKFGGRLAILNRADRSAELIYELKSRGLEPKRMQFVSGGEGAKPYLVMVEAVKGGKEGVDVLPAIINARNGNSNLNQ